jgi:diacylglycerol kinase (ATP)
MGGAMSLLSDSTDLLTPPAASRVVLPGRIGIVRNPRSHRNKAGVPAAVESDNILVAAPASRDDLTGALADFADRGVELIVVDGGDGTVRDLLTRGAAIFGEAWPRLMVVPKGKTNALALDLGMPARMTLEAALGAVQGARIERRRALRIEPCDGSRPAVHGFIMATGAFNAAIDAAQITHRLGAFQGLAVGLTTAIGVAMTVLGIGEGPWRALSPTRIVTAEGSELPHSRHGRAGKRWVAGFSTLTTFPLGMRPFAGSGQSAAAAIGCIVVDAPLRRVVAQALAILRGAGGPRYAALGVHRAASSEFEIALAGRFILDGESFPPGTYRVGLGPELEFLVP